MSENSKNDSRQLGAAHNAEKSSRLSEIIFYLLSLTLIFTVVAFGAVDVWALGVVSLLTGSMAVLWLADAYRKKEFDFNSTAMQIPPLALILIGLIQLLPLRGGSGGDLLSIPASRALSLAPYSTRLAIIQLLVYFIFFAAALRFINNEKRLRKIVLTIIIFAASMAFFGILQRLANLQAIYGLRPFNQTIPFASFVNQHHFAALMEMTMGITLGLLFGRATKSNKRIFLAFAIVIMGIALVFTGSRGAMLSLLGVIGFVVVANLFQKPAGEPGATGGGDKVYRRNFAVIIGGFALLLVLFGAVLLLGGDESLLRIIGLHNLNDISDGRFHFWQMGWQIFLDYPILGAGLDSFGVAFTRYDTWSGYYRVEQAHNDYLQVLAESGIAGFACIAAFIFLLFKQSAAVIVKSPDNFRRGAATGALAGCLGILIHSFFDFPLRTPANTFFFLTLAALATVSIAPKPARKKHRKKTIEEQ